MLSQFVLFGFRFFRALKRKVQKVYTIYYLKQFRFAGTNISIKFPVTIEGKENVSIGSNTAIGTYTHIWGNGKVDIGENVLIAAHCCISSLNHNYNRSLINIGGNVSKSVIIGDDVWLGYNVVILPGVKIGRGSVIGAGSVVVSDVPEYSIVVGNPAKVIKKRVIAFD